MYMCMYVCVCKYRVIFLYNIPICLTWDVNISSIGGDTCMELFTYHVIYIYFGYSRYEFIIPTASNT